MKSQQICLIFVVCLITSSFGDSTQKLFVLNEETRHDPSPQKQLYVYVFDNVSLLAKEYANSSVQISRNILKDESLVAHEESEIVEFKESLKMFVKLYDDSGKDVETIWYLIQHYGRVIKKYLEMSEDKMTPESKFISDLLNKYDCENNQLLYAMKFHEIADQFIKKFEESKEHIDGRLVKWFDRYKTFTKFEDRFGALMEYLVVMGLFNL